MLRIGGKYYIIMLVIWMLDQALKVLKKIEDNGFVAYIVGGFVRDYLLGIESMDIDICTNATPKELKEIFEDACIPSEDYGAVILENINHHFEITTFRKEEIYSDDRKPIEIKYINDLKEDLKRRDFTINTICMDSNKNIIDLLGGRKDLEDKTIRCVGNIYLKFSQDPLRILRALRFATILDFEIVNDVKYEIKKSRGLLKKLSYNRKREELDKIFSSPNMKKGIELIKELDLMDSLELKNLDKVLEYENLNDLIGVWAVIDVCDIYPFSNNEKSLIKKISELYDYGSISPMTLYKYDLYVNSVVGSMLGIDKKEIVKMYGELTIHKRSDICINGDDIISILKIEPSKDIDTILSDIEERIILGKLENDRKAIGKYVVKKYL